MYRKPLSVTPLDSSSWSSFLLSVRRCILKTKHIIIAVPDEAIQIAYELMYVGPQSCLGQTYLTILNVKRCLLI